MGKVAVDRTVRVVMEPSETAGRGWGDVGRARMSDTGVQVSAWAQPRLAA